MESEPVRTVRAEVRIRGKNELEVRHGCGPGVTAIMAVSALASFVFAVYGVAADADWALTFSMVTAFVLAEVRAQAWRAAAKRMATALVVATEGSFKQRLLRPSRKTETN